MPQFTAKILGIEGFRGEPYICESFNDIPYDLLHENGVTHLILDFYDGLEKPFELDLAIKNGHISYLDNISTEIGPGAIQTILRKMENAQVIFTFAAFLDKKRSETARKNFIDRNNILFDQFDKENSWTMPLVAVAAAGLVGVLNKKKVEEPEVIEHGS